MYLKYILILLKFVFTILFTILMCLRSLRPRSGLLYHLETQLYNHVNCSTSRHKTTAVVGGALGRLIFNGVPQGTLGRRGEHGGCMDLRRNVLAPGERREEIR